MRCPIVHVGLSEGFLLIIPLATVLFERADAGFFRPRMKHAQRQRTAGCVDAVLKRRERNELGFEPQRRHGFDARLASAPLFYFRIMRNIVRAMHPPVFALAFLNDRCVMLNADATSRVVVKDEELRADDLKPPNARIVFHSQVPRAMYELAWNGLNLNNSP